MYLARHACKQHPAIARAEAEVRQWAQGRSGVGQPCRWCQVGHKQTSKAHQRACPVLWACGHLQNAFHTLRPSGQTDLRRHVRRADTGNPASSPGASTVRGVCAEADNLFSHNCPFRRPAHLLPRQEMDTKDTEKRAGEDPEHRASVQVAEGLRKGGQQPKETRPCRTSAPRKGAHETGSEASRHVKPTCSWTWASWCFSRPP